MERPVDPRHDAEWDDILSGRARKDVEESLGKEKVHIPKEALKRLPHLLEHSWTEEEMREVYRRELAAIKVVT